MPVKLKDDKRLLEAVEKAKRHKMTAEELRKQRESYVFGSMPEEADATRQQIADILAKQDGRS